jgi:hypothetical protein
MRRPLYRSDLIAWVTALGALAAFDFTMAVAWIDRRNPTGDLLLVGAMPMANVLAVGVLIGLRRVGSRPFLWGFEVFGVVALASYVLVATLSPGVLWANAEPLVNYVRRTFGRHGPFVCILIIFFSATVMLVLPQVTFAVTGGFLGRKFRSTITPR